MLQKNMKATNHAVTEYGRGVRQAGSNSVGNVFFFLSLRVGKEFMGHLAQTTVFIRSKQHWGTVKSDFYEDCTVRYSRGWASNSDMLHALI